MSGENLDVPAWVDTPANGEDEAHDVELDAFLQQSERASVISDFNTLSELLRNAKPSPPSPLFIETKPQQS